MGRAKGKGVKSGKGIAGRAEKGDKKGDRHRQKAKIGIKNLSGISGSPLGR